MPELKAELSSRSLPTTGNKADLVARLQADDKKKAEEAAPAAAAAPTAEDEIDWDDDTEVKPNTSKPVETIPAEPAAETKIPASSTTAPAATVTTNTSAENTADMSKKGDNVVTTGDESAAPEVAAPKEDFSAHLAPTSADDEARKRAERAKRFGLDTESEEMKKAKRAEKFGIDSNTIARGLDAALPERTARKRGHLGSATATEAGGDGAVSGRPAKRTMPDRRGGPGGRFNRSKRGGSIRGRGGPRGGFRGGEGRSRIGGGGGRKSILDDPAEKAKAEARTKRFAAS